MTTNGEKVTLLAEIIRVSGRGATAAEISEELSLASIQAEAYIRLLKARGLLVLVDHKDYFPTQKGLAYLALYDDASDLADVDSPQAFCSGKPENMHNGVYWDRAELAARMREIIDR